MLGASATVSASNLTTGTRNPQHSRLINLHKHIKALNLQYQTQQQQHQQ